MYKVSDIRFFWRGVLLATCILVSHMHLQFGNEHRRPQRSPVACLKYVPAVVGVDYAWGVPAWYKYPISTGKINEQRHRAALPLPPSALLRSPVVCLKETALVGVDCAWVPAWYKIHQYSKNEQRHRAPSALLRSPVVCLKDCGRRGLCLGNACIVQTSHHEYGRIAEVVMRIHEPTCAYRCCIALE